MEKLPITHENHNVNPLLVILLWTALVLCPLLGFSQTVKSVPPSNNKLTTLEQVVENIKQNNQSIKNADNVNVMVNDMLIKDLKDFTLDPKNISMVEVLVLKPQTNGGKQINSIIINTK